MFLQLIEQQVIKTYFNFIILIKYPVSGIRKKLILLILR